MTLCALCDLFAATEAVGDYEPITGGLADSGQEFKFADGLRDFVFVTLKTERARHAAAAGGRSSKIDAKAVKDGFFRSHLHDGFLMAMAMEDRFAIEFRQRDLLCFQKFAEQEDLA